MSIPDGSSRSSRVVEVSSRTGGECTFTRYFDASGDDLYSLESSEGVGRSRARSGWATVLKGSPLIAIGLWLLLGMVALADPTSLGAYMLPASPCWVIPLSLVLAYVFGRMFAPQAGGSFFATFGDTVIVDGEDVGSLLRVEPDISRCEVLLVTEHGRTSVEVGSESDAVILADAIASAVLSGSDS